MCENANELYDVVAKNMHQEELQPPDQHLSLPLEEDF